MAVYLDSNINRTWVYRDVGEGKLNYNVVSDTAVFDEDSANTNDSNQNENKISYFDIKDINVRNCSFSDFCKAIKFVKDSCSTLNYDEKLLDSFGNQFAEGEELDFYQYFDDYRLDCAKRGDIQLYHQIVKIEQAAFDIIDISRKDNSNNLTTNGYFKTNIFNDECNFGSYATYRLGVETLKIDDRYYQFVAEYDADSTEENPVIAVKIGAYSSSGVDKIEGTYVVDINSIDLKNATPIELFAYDSYKMSSNKENWEKDYNTNLNLKKIYQSGAFETNSLDDFVSKKYNIMDVLISAKEKMQEKRLNNTKQVSLEELSTQRFTDEYIDECLEIYDRLIELLKRDEEEQ